MRLFQIAYADGWDEYFLKLDRQIQTRIWKKIQQLKMLPTVRHLKHGLPFFVLEIGQYRICFEERAEIRSVVFAGTHKQYEQWYKRQ